MKRARLVKGLIGLHIIGVPFCMIVAYERHNWAPIVSGVWLFCFGVFLFRHALPAAKKQDEFNRWHG